GFADAAGVSHETDDRPAAPRRHAADDRVGDQQRTLHRDVDLCRPVGRRCLEEALALRRRRIVDENVDRTELTLDSIDGCHHRGFVPQVGADREALDAERSRLLGGALRTDDRGMIVKGHVPPLRRERQSDRAPESLSGARHQNHLVVQAQVHASAILSATVDVKSFSHPLAQNLAIALHFLLSVRHHSRAMIEQTPDDVTRAPLAAIVDSCDDAIVSKTLEGGIITWNRAAERSFGYSAAEAVGRHITLIIPLERHAEEDDVLARIRRGEIVDHFETVRQTKDGRRLIISLTVSPIRDASGTIV